MPNFAINDEVRIIKGDFAGHVGHFVRNANASGSICVVRLSASGNEIFQAAHKLELVNKEKEMTECFITEVFTPEISEGLQKSLFEAGFDWRGDNTKKIQHTNSKYIGIEDTRIVYSYSDSRCTVLSMSDFVAKFCQKTSSVTIGGKIIIIRHMTKQLEYQGQLISFQFIEDLIARVEGISPSFYVGDYAVKCQSFTFGCLTFTYDQLKGLAAEISKG